MGQISAGGGAAGTPVLEALLKGVCPPRQAPSGLAGGIAMGAGIATPDGVLPVEYLAPGDRIVTRSGLRVLRRVVAGEYVGRLVRVVPGALGHDRPGRALVLGPVARLLMRDWRV